MGGGETGVYVDVLLVINYAINLLLLLCSGKIVGKVFRRKRLVLAATAGAFSSLIIFYPFHNPILQILYQITVSGLMVLIAFGFQGTRVFCRRLFVLFTVSFLFAGIMLAVYMTLMPRNMLYLSGVVYFDIPAGLLITLSVLAYAVLTVFNRIFSKKLDEHHSYVLEVFYRGGSVKLNAIVDTGNGLREPFSETPVIVCTAAQLESIYTPWQENNINLRMIPYKTVGKEGVLSAFLPDKVIVTGGGTRFEVRDVYIALTNDSVGNGEYSALINPEILKSGCLLSTNEK